MYENIRAVYIFTILFLCNAIRGGGGGGEILCDQKNIVNLYRRNRINHPTGGKLI